MKGEVSMGWNDRRSGEEEERIGGDGKVWKGGKSREGGEWERVGGEKQIVR